MSYLFGINGVASQLQHGADRIQRLLYVADSRNRRVSALVDQARAAGVDVEVVDRARLDSLADGTRHQDIAAVISANNLRGEGELSAWLEQRMADDNAPLLLVLDGIQDPHNLGACLRSAEAAGVAAVILPKDRSADLSPVVRRTASGAAELLTIFQVTNLARALRALKQAGIWLAGAAGEADRSLYEIDLTGPLAVVMGNEGQGLRRLTREHCDYLLHIPMSGRMESLNVSVATGICLFEATRQRRTAPAQR